MGFVLFTALLIFLVLLASIAGSISKLANATFLTAMFHYSWAKEQWGDAWPPSPEELQKDVDRMKAKSK